ncbi:sulfite reductase [Powellomyces hirtus]|nr:sulfite reductase [Powellomyces hirtus]
MTVSQTLNVETALAYIGFDLSDTVIVTGDSNIRDLCSEWTTQGTQNLFNSAVSTTFVSNIRAELHGVVHSLIAPKSLITLYISASDLINTIPTLYTVIGDRAPLVIHAAVADPTDVGDVFAIRQTGAILLASNSVQEGHDIGLVAHSLAVKHKIPVVHLYDASAPALKSQKIQTADYKSGDFLANLKTEVDGYKKNDPISQVVDQLKSTLFLKPTAQSNIDYAQVSQSIGNQVGAFEYTGEGDASQILVALGTNPVSLADAVAKLAQTGQKVGVLRVRAYRPWSEEDFLAAVPSSVETITVVDTAHSLSTAWGPLFLDVAASFHSGKYQGKPPVLREGRVHIPTQGYTVEFVKSIIAQAVNADQGVFNVGSPAVHINGVHNGVIDFESTNEGPYIKILEQLFPDRASVANISSESSVYGKHGAAAPEANAEFGFGMHLVLVQNRARFANSVSEVLKASKSDDSISEELRKELGSWFQYRDDAEKSLKHGKVAISLLEKERHQHATLQAIYEDRAFFSKPSRWVIGGDQLSYDVGNSGVHHVISSKEDINMLVLDTQPYSEKIAPTQQDKRKKDIGLYAMQYGSAYVASVAINSSYAQVVRAFMEADAYPGPSVVLAYAPKISKTGKGVSVPLAMLKETKIAVDSGYWPLYRWNPSLDAAGQEPFALDSEKVKREIVEFLDRENHLAYVLSSKPEVAAHISANAEKELKNAIENKVQSSYSQLLSSLNAQPLLVLYGSDGGNAEAVAKRLGSEAKQRGLRPRVMAADSFSVEDLPSEQSVVYVVSTAGQGEFPGNAKETWKALQSAGADLDLTKTRFAVLALGDRNYWPLPGDKHYFAKSGKDLDHKLETLGAGRLTPLGVGDDQDPDGLWTGVNAWRPILWQALGVDEVDVNVEPVLPSDDAIKESSNYLRGTIAEGLVDTSTGALAELDTKLSKFHGIYQQDDRDTREERARQGQEPAFSFMVRCRIPGGVVTPEQWIAVDQIADKWANGTIKITTRQTFQYHGIIKRGLKASIQDMNRALMDTIAACGDVNRNVLCNPNEHSSEVNAAVLKLARDWSEHMLPHTNAYHEIWLDKKLVATTQEESEPLYGKTYLPRKFKCAIAVPPNNDVDVFANDLGYIAIIEKGKIVGYNVTVGGGMGMTHGNKKTYPRLGDVLGFCTPEQAIDVGEKVVTVQRDYGDRTNRKHARLKYTIDDRGIEWFRKEVETRLGWTFPPARPYKFVSNGDRFGWVQESDGSWAFTMFIANGRVRDAPGSEEKTALKLLAELLVKEKAGEIRLTANQHLVVARIPPSLKPTIEGFLQKHKLHSEHHSAMRLNSMACVALPTCGLAMAESERYLPSLITKLDSILDSLGLRSDAISIRMTGCPNGCARPQIAEIGFVGKAPGTYNLYLGGGFSGTRLSKMYKESVGEAEILASLKPLLTRWSQERVVGEHFGDWVIRAGIVKETTAGMNFHD